MRNRRTVTTFAGEVLSHPKVYICILNWNGLADTIECLNSVGDLNYPNFEVIVVDNGSTDNQASRLRHLFKDIVVIENGENLGYTGGNNVGMEYAFKKGADYVWLLNNDTILHTNALSRLVQEAESSPCTGIASPMIRNYYAPAFIQFCGGLLDSEHFRVRYTKSWEESLYWQNTMPDRISLVGTAMLIKRYVIETIGHLDDKFFAYWEDIDYSVRSTHAGFRNIVVNDSVVFHKTPLRGQRELVSSPGYYYYMVRNEYLFWSKHLRSLSKPAYLRKYLLSVAEQYHFCRSEISETCADACIEGAWGAFLGRGGARKGRQEMPAVLKRMVVWHPNFLAHLIGCDIVNVFFLAFRKLKLLIRNPGRPRV